MKKEKAIKKDSLSGGDFSIEKNVAKTKKPISRARSFEEILKSKVAKTAIKKKITQEILKIKKQPADVRIYASPYAYIYADYLKNGKHEKLIRAVENRLTDLGISGRIHRLSQFKNLEEIIEEDSRRGITTVVVVGDDRIADEAIRCSAELNIVLGIIPVGEENELAALFGIPEGVAACDILSQRILDNIDVGKINNRIFLSGLHIAGSRAPLLCDGRYEILASGGDVDIYNLNIDPKNGPHSNPKDSKLEVVVRPKNGLATKLGFGKQAESSLFFAKEIKIKSNVAFAIFVDGKKSFYKDVEIEIMPKKLKVVVGKNRLI